MSAAWFLAVVVFIGALGGLSWLGAKRRREALQALARRMGFTYSEQASCSLSGLPLFERGRSRSAHNALSGSASGHPVTLMDYRYTVGSGKNRRTHTQTVALFSEAGGDLPELALLPESLVHKIGQIFGYQDIDFEADPEFSRRFLLRGADEARIRTLFDASLRAACCRHFDGWTLEVGGGRVLVFRAGKTVGAEEIRAFLSTSSRIVETLQGKRR
jgi:hypothetical protein